MEIENVAQMLQRITKELEEWQEVYTPCFLFLEGVLRDCADKNNMQEAASFLKEAGAVEKVLEGMLKKVTSLIELTKKNLLPEIMDNLGLTSAKIDGVGTAYLRDDMYVSCAAGDRDTLFEWLLENGFGGIITESVHPATLKASVKEWLVQGVELPDVIKVTPYTQAVLLKK